MSLNAITECRECGSTALSWDTHSKSDSGVQEGRLRSHEVKCLFVLGCDDCSETLAILSAERVAGLLNAARTPATATPITIGGLKVAIDANLPPHTILITGAAPKRFPCWSCKEPVTLEERAEHDGNCPHCRVELDLEDWPSR